MNLECRIDAAIKRITDGHAPMRIPVDRTDPDVVLADCKAALVEARGLLGRAHSWMYGEGNEGDEDLLEAVASFLARTPAASPDSKVVPTLESKASHLHYYDGCECGPAATPEARVARLESALIEIEEAVGLVGQSEKIQQIARAALGKPESAHRPADPLIETPCFPPDPFQLRTVSEADTDHVFLPRPNHPFEAGTVRVLCRVCGRPRAHHAR